MKDWLSDHIYEIIIGIAILAALGAAVNAARHPTRTVVIDGCEYLETRTADGDKSLIHKGNCTNEIHWRRLEHEH